MGDIYEPVRVAAVQAAFFSTEKDRRKKPAG
jgi:hypothetical protein